MNETEGLFIQLQVQLALRCLDKGQHELAACHLKAVNEALLELRGGSA